MSEEQEETITISADDDCFVRADKLLRMAGMRNAGRLADSMARGVKIYMDLDKKAQQAKEVE